MVFESIAGGLLKAALPKVAVAIATAVKNKLNPTELEKALKVGLQKSGALDRGQKVNNAVFYRCTDKDADTFLAALLEHPDVQRELQKPLEQDGAPDVAILVQVAKHIAADRTLDISDETLEPWLKTFANAYFDAITAIRFQVAKDDYLEQLANWFDDVKFAGVAVPGQDVERAERLAQIFVMPDVETELRRTNDWQQSEDEVTQAAKQLASFYGGRVVDLDRQSQLLQEQRLRSQLERSGRKFSARQLLNQHQKKIVLLGAPGSGKTTLMSFFAVTLAEQQGSERQGAIATASDVHAEGLSGETKGLSPNTMALSGDTKGLSPNTMALSGDTKGLSDETMALRPNTMSLSGDTKGLLADTEGLRLDAEALQTDADVLLPILIRIRDWARTPDVTLPEYARQFAETTMSCKPLPKGFFEHWLNNGRALILLDGLDEVAEEAKRYHLVQCIENFLGQYPQNRAIITSRPAGYKRDFFRTEEFPHYELQPFDDGKIEEFCDRWYTSRVPDKAEAQRRKESLQKALNQQDRIKLLARNPLLLTIIALIHRYQARLPRERYKLYDKAVETLLTSWDDNKELSNQTVLKYLQLDDLRRLMEHLAYWIHTQGNTGDAEGGTLIDKDELIHQLTQEIKTLKQLQLYEAKEEAKRFVEFIRDRTGLLNEQGQDCYAFVHKTFQEYLAAQDINYQADNEDDFEIVLAHIEQHLHDAHWREVLLLLIAQQSPKKAARAIRKVLDANSPYEQWLYRDLLFAGRCLAEDPKGLEGADLSLPSEILVMLAALERFSNSNHISWQVRAQVLEIGCSFHGTKFDTQVLQWLKTNVIEQDRLRTYRVAFGEEDAVIEELLAMLEQDSGVIYRAAGELIDLSNKSNIVLQRLLALLQHENYKVRSIAACVLGGLNNTSNVVLQGLLALLNDEDRNVRCSAADALGKLGNTSDAVVQGLLALLNDEDWDVRYFATCSLVNLYGTSNTLQQGLLVLLKNENSAVRYGAIDALGKLGSTSDVVLQALLELLNDKDYEVCSRATYALAKLGDASDVVLQRLLTLVQDDNYIVRLKAAEALGKLCSMSEVLQELLTLLQDDNPSVRSTIATALGGLRDTSGVVLKELLALLQDESSVVRGNTAATLGKLGKRSNQVEPAIVQWIEQHQDEDCVGAGIDALWEIVEGEG